MRDTISIPQAAGAVQELFLPRMIFAQRVRFAREASSSWRFNEPRGSMLKHITVALHGSHRHADRVPVRRHSHLAGRSEALFWRRIDRQEGRRILLGARRLELVGRAPGRRNGPLGHVALEVLELLVNLMDRRTGRLEPSIDTIAAMIRRARSAVIEALKRLKAHGLVDWLRRYEETGCEGRGPQVRQVSNAYRVLLPPRVARLLGVQSQDVPLPDDLFQDLDDRRQELAAIKAALSLHELAVVEVDDGPLGRALAGLGRRIQERESARGSESQTRLFI